MIRVNLRDLERLLGKPLELRELYKGLARLKCEIEAVSGDILEYEASHDRPDLFSCEGLARALRPFLGLPRKDYRIVDSSRVKGYAEHIAGRPYIALAVVRDVELDNEAITQIMQLQEKLASIYGRNRRKASIGVYDLDAIEPPIYYKAVDPDAVRYIPLNESREITLREVLMETEKGRLYGYIIESMDKYPVLMDSKNRVLSLAPILNADFNKVTSSTRNILIDSTGVDPQLVIDVVTIMSLSIAERSKSGIVESVEVVYPDGSVLKAPRERGNTIRVNVKEVRRLLGVNLEPESVAGYLGQHYYKIKAVEGDSMDVEAPAYRIDVRSWVDVAEDIAISIGYNTLGGEAASLPHSVSIGRMHPLEYYSRRIRDILVGLGLSEVANYMLSSMETQRTLLGQRSLNIFTLENPRSEKYAVLRAWLSPGILETIVENAGRRSRIMIFEIGDVVIPDESMETNARVERRLCIAISHRDATLTDGLAVIKALSRELGLEPSFMKTSMEGFLEERTSLIVVKGRRVGFIGEVDPRILYKLRVENPVVIGEIVLNELISMFQ